MSSFSKNMARIDGYFASFAHKGPKIPAGKLPSDLDFKVVDPRQGETLLFPVIRRHGSILLSFDTPDMRKQLELRRQKVLEVVELLVNEGVEINAANSWGQTALHVAVGFGQLEAIKLLLDRGAAINAVDRDGKSVLYYALVGSQGGCPELLRFLIDRGCDFHIVDPKCGSLLFYAAMKGFSAIVDELLQASDGSDIDLNPIDLQLLRSHFQSEEAYDSDEELVNQSLWSTLFKACPQVGALYKDLRLIALQLEIGEHYLAIDRCAYRYYAEMDKLGLYNLSNPPANPSAE